MKVEDLWATVVRGQWEQNSSMLSSTEPRACQKLFSPTGSCACESRDGLLAPCPMPPCPMPALGKGCRRRCRPEQGLLWSNCFKEAGSGPRPMPWLGARLFHKGLAEPLWGELARALRLWWGGWPLSVLTHWFTHQHCSHCSPEQSCLSQPGLLYYSLGGWNNRHLILIALVPGKSKIKILCLVRLTSWFADSHLLASSHGGEQRENADPAHDDSILRT